jgi:hypothetical protein
MHLLFSILLALVFIVNPASAATPVTAENPDEMTIMKKTKEVFEPMRPTKRKINITVSSKGVNAELVAGQAIKNLPDGKRMVLVMLAPENVKGTAFLLWEQKDKPDVMYVYLPSIRRVRAMEGFIDQQTSFMGTDFTYADLGFLKVHKNYRLVGKERHGGIQAYKIEAKAPELKLYYSRGITWVAADTFLPLQRDFYDASGALWKTELFENVSVIDGVPTPLLVTMKDLTAGQSTSLALSMVEYDLEVPDSIFDPKALPQVSEHACWGAYCPVTIPKE